MEKSRRERKRVESGEPRAEPRNTRKNTEVKIEQEIAHEEERRRAKRIELFHGTHGKEPKIDRARACPLRGAAVRELAYGKEQKRAEIERRAEPRKTRKNTEVKIEREIAYEEERRRAEEKSKKR